MRRFSFSGVFLAVLVTFLVVFGGVAGEAGAIECSSSPCTVDNNINLFYAHIERPVASDECGLDDPCSTTPMIHVGKYGGTCLDLNKVEEMRVGFNGLGGLSYWSGNLYIELSDQASSGRKSFATYLLSDGINDWKRYVTYPKDKVWLESNGLLEPDPWCSGNKYSYYIYFWDDGWFGNWQIKNTYLYLLYKSNFHATPKVTFSVPVSQIASAELVFDVTGSGDPLLDQGKLQVDVFDWLTGDRLATIVNEVISGSATKYIDVEDYLRDGGIGFDFWNWAGSSYLISNIKIEYTVVCSDGTPYEQCSINKPKYCDNGNLVDNCQLCDCPYGYYCKPDGSCGQDCTSGACCDISIGKFKSSDSQPNGYTDYYYCSGTDSATETSHVKYRNYYCDGQSSSAQHTDSTADTCGTCEYCTDGDSTCNYYGSSTTCGTQDCDYLDNSCRNYHDVNRYCDGFGGCSSATCNSYTNEPEGTPCGTDMECDGDGNCVGKCDCIDWVNKGCGQGGCLSTEMYQTRICTPSGCASELQCILHPSCVAGNIVCSSDDDCGTSETCSGGVCSPFAPEIDIRKDGSLQDKTFLDASKALNKIIKMKHDPNDITWSDDHIIVNIYSINPGYSIEKVYLYPCKKLSPTSCLTQGTKPEIASNRLYTELRFYDISEREGIATYPQIANLLIFVKLRGPDNKVTWISFWDRIERTNYNFPTPYHHNYNLDVLEYYEKSEDLTRGVKYFIDNRLMVPFNSEWVERAVFQGVKRGNVVIGDVYNLCAIGANGAELENELETFDIAVTNTNEVTAINKDYYFIFPNSTHGQIASPLTLNLNPKCISDSDCGTNEVCLNGQCVPTCSDGTAYGECSLDKPKYCDNGNLIDKCKTCDCPSGHTCLPNDSCIYMDCTIPEYGMVITQDTVFCPGTYDLVGGGKPAIKIDTSNIILNCNGAILVGDFNSAAGGAIYIKKDNMTVKNCVIKNFMYGSITIESAGNLIINNTITTNDFDIYFVGWGNLNNTRILYNNFSHMIYATSFPRMSSLINYNNLDGVKIYTLWGDTGKSDVDFTYNWWGTTNCSEIAERFYRPLGSEQHISIKKIEPVLDASYPQGIPINCNIDCLIDSDCLPEEECKNGNCIAICTNECSSGETKCNGNYAQTCGDYDTDDCLEWPPELDGAGNEYCGETTHGNWTSSYCSEGIIMHNRTVHEKGCSAGECYANETLETEIVGVCEGDATKDCEVNVFDLARVGLCYGCKHGDLCWDDCSNADVKPDEKIDIFDLATVGLNYGRTC